MKKFPLAPLVELRAQAVETCRESLQEADLHLQKAQQTHARAEQLEREHDAGWREVEESEVALLARGELVAADLAQMADYATGARAEALRLRQHNQAQSQKVQRAQREVVGAAQALAEARAEQRVIERRRERFEQVERAGLETDADDEALDNWHARKVPC